MNDLIFTDEEEKRAYIEWETNTNFMKYLRKLIYSKKLCLKNKEEEEKEKYNVSHKFDFELSKKISLRKKNINDYSLILKILDEMTPVIFLSKKELEEE